MSAAVVKKKRTVKIQVLASRAGFLRWVACQDIDTLRYASALADAFGTVGIDDPHVAASAVLSRLAAKHPQLLSRARLESLFTLEAA